MPYVMRTALTLAQLHQLLAVATRCSEWRAAVELTRLIRQHQ